MIDRKGYKYIILLIFCVNYKSINLNNVLLDIKAIINSILFLFIFLSYDK